MKTIQLKDFLDFSFLSNLQVNANNQIVFCESVCNEQDNQYEQRLCIIKEGNLSYLTSAKKESNFILNDDEVIFTSVRDKEDIDAIANHEELTCFYRISLHGGEANKIFKVPYQVNRFEMVDDDHYVMHVNYDVKHAHLSNEERIQTIKDNEDYELFDNIPFYFNGRGFCKGKIGRLYVYTLSTKQMTPITNDNINVGQFNLSEDRQSLYYVASELKPRPSLKDGVYMYSFGTSTTTTLVNEKEYSIHHIEAMKDYVIMIANKEKRRSNNDNPYFYKIHKNEITLLNNDGISIGNTVGSDCRFGGGQSCQVVNDELYFIVTDKDKAILCRLDQNGDIHNELEVNGSIDCFTIRGNTIYYVGLCDNKLQEVYRADAQVSKQLTYMNTKLDDKYVAKYEEIEYENDGITFTGWVLLPQDYDASKTYPAILDIHGGPKTVYGKVYYHEMQVWANMGYVVFFTNPRGSDGFKDEFSDIYGKYGTIDYDDLMTFTDVVLKRYAIDPKRVGVTGGSYGGFMTNWIITHTNRFACAATQRSISNWVSFYGTSDIGFHFAEDQIRANIFDNVEKLWEHSPLKYARNVTTPTLFIHSDEDYRCPLEQGLQLYTALVDLNVETKFVMFKKENHELSRSGLPRHRVKRLQEITDWMESHLK